MEEKPGWGVCVLNVRNWEMGFRKRERRNAVQNTLYEQYTHSACTVHTQYTHSTHAQYSTQYNTHVPFEILCRGNDVTFTQ